MFSKFFIERPIFASVISLIILIAGIVAIKTLPVQEYPNVVPPQIILSTTYSGADAKTLEVTVAAPLEQQLNGLENMIYMVSTTSPSGAFNIYLFFEVGTDIAQAKIDVNNRVQMASNKLPDAVKKQGLMSLKNRPMYCVLSHSHQKRVFMIPPTLLTMRLTISLKSLNAFLALPMRVLLAIKTTPFAYGLTLKSSLFTKSPRQKFSVPFEIKMKNTPLGK